MPEDKMRKPPNNRISGYFLRKSFIIIKYGQNSRTNKITSEVKEKLQLLIDDLIASLDVDE